MARGSLLVAQSLVDENLRDGLVYRSKYLPPKNSDFGKKRVLFESNQGKVDYADVEVFYPADSKNHPSGGLPGWVYNSAAPCTPCVRTETPNWFFYYSDAYGCRDIEYITGEMSFYCRSSDRVFIADSASPSRGEWTVYLFVLATRMDACGRLRPMITQATYHSWYGLERDLLWVRGIHRFISLVEHERAHRELYRRGLQVPRGEDNHDLDWDSVPDDIEPQIGLDPCDRWSAAYPFPFSFPFGDPDGDGDVLAEIIAYAKIKGTKRLWELDWADSGLQRGIPHSPFPWRYSSTGLDYVLRTDLLEEIQSIPYYSDCQCSHIRR
ncbi:MAG: hypothetical protein WHS44_09550 [Fimbriimonadales bacterium]